MLLDVPVRFGALLFSDPAVPLTLGRFSFREAGERVGVAAVQVFSCDCRDNESKNGVIGWRQREGGTRDIGENTRGGSTRINLHDRVYTTFSCMEGKVE